MLDWWALSPAGAVQAKHLTQDQYAMNHPAGRIGRRLTLRVADVMLTGHTLMPLVCLLCLQAGEPGCCFRHALHAALWVVQLLPDHQAVQLTRLSRLMS